MLSYPKQERNVHTMRKNKAIRLLSGTLAALTLFGGFSIVSAADTSPASSYDLHDLGGLTDVLSTIKYAEYLQRHGDPSQYDLTGRHAGSGCGEGLQP